MPQTSAGATRTAVPPILGVVLAAGLGRRFGADKLAAELAGRPVLAWSVSGMLQVAHRLTGVAVVTGAWAAGDDGPPALLAQVTSAILENGGATSGVVHAPPLQWIANSNAEEGQAASVRLAVTAARRAGVAGLLICLGDMPAVGAAVLNPVLNAWLPGSVAIAEGPQGATPPVVFPADLFDDLLALRGDRGAKSVWQAGRAPVHRVRIPAPAEGGPDDGPWWRDVDRPDDLRALAAHWPGQQPRGGSTGR